MTPRTHCAGMRVLLGCCPPCGVCCGSHCDPCDVDALGPAVGLGVTVCPCRGLWRGRSLQRSQPLGRATGRGPSLPDLGLQELSHARPRERVLLRQVGLLHASCIAPDCRGSLLRSQGSAAVMRLGGGRGHFP